MNRMNGRWLLAGIVIALMVALRFVGIANYPGFDVDEGLWAGGARNFVLFGDALMDDRLDPLTTPGHFVQLAGFFKLLAPSLLTARIFSAVAGVVTCLMVALIALREFPRRTWLFPVLFGFSAAIFFQRLAMLEADQTFWLVLAALIWLSPRRELCWFAGAAYGMALLVKSNSIYLMPVYLLTTPGLARDDGKPAWRTSLAFFALTAVVAGSGYLWDRWLDPTSFALVFGFQLDATPFLDPGLLFHVGRFGLNPGRIAGAIAYQFTHDPLFVVLALAGLVYTIRHFRKATRADQFFAGWFVCGAVFTLGQVHVEIRYLSTLTPAMAYLAARLLSDWLDRRTLAGSGSRAYAVVVAVIVLSAAFQVSRVLAGIHRHWNSDYWQTVAWVEKNVPRNAHILGSPVFNLSFPQQGFDFYRPLFPYAPPGQSPTHTLESVVSRFAINYVLVDRDWNSYQTRDMADYLSFHGKQVFGVGEVTIYRLD